MCHTRQNNITSCLKSGFVPQHDSCGTLVDDQAGICDVEVLPDGRNPVRLRNITNVGIASLYGKSA